MGLPTFMDGHDYRTNNKLYLIVNMDEIGNVKKL